MEHIKMIFPKPSQVDVSIWVFVQNGSRNAYRCLKSLQEHTKGNYEVIVHCHHTHDRQEIQDRTQNVTIICDEDGPASINHYNFKTCRGKYIFFLNSDMAVTENWLEPQLKIMSSEGAGTVCSKRVSWDGKLLAAGGITFRDGSCRGYGSGDNPEKPQYNYVREVDDCGGMAFLVKRELFEKISGFDPHYRSSVHAVSDLCFSIRALCYKIFYQPASTVVCLEPSNAGQSVIKKLINEYTDKRSFRKKWDEALRKDYYDNKAGLLFYARTRSSGKNILVIDRNVPTFDRDSGSQRLFNMLKILHEIGHNVTFIGDNPGKFEPYTSILQQQGIEVIYDPFATSIHDHLVDYGKYYDDVLVCRYEVTAKHISDLKKYCTKAKIIFDTVDLHYLRAMRQSEIEHDPALMENALKVKDCEYILARNSDLTLVVSSVEKDLLLKEDPDLRVDVLSNIHDAVEDVAPFSSRRDILFIGGFPHAPNVDGIDWFIRDIFPLIKQHLPGVKLYVVGNGPPEAIRALANDDILVTGYVPDVSSYFTRCRISISPLRYGAGVKGKIGQSMSFGLPVVTTGIGAEGMGLIDGKNALLANDPSSFSQKVVQLYNDNSLWDQLSKNSLEHIKNTFSTEVARERLKMIIGPPE